MDTAAFETDRMLNLLTEALRRGPGSPEWHKAVSDLRDVASPEADEYRMLIRARERLDGGRAYREVRAGPAFTRDLFGQLNATTDAPRPVPLGVVVKLLCLLTLVTAIGLLLLWVLQARPADPAGRLSAQLFVTPLQSWELSAGLPRHVYRIGAMPVETSGNGLHPGRDGDVPDGVMLVSPQSLDLVRGVCLEARIEFRPGPVDVRLALAENAIGDRRASGDALWITCDDGGVSVSSAGVKAAPRSLVPGPHLLRLKVLGDAAVVEIDGQTLWTGRQSLGGRGYAAVALDRTAHGPSDCSIESLRVLAP